MEALGSTGAEAHGADHLGIAARGFRNRHALGTGNGLLTRRLPHPPISDDRYSHQRGHAGQSNHTQHRVQHEDEGEKKRHPRQINEGDRHRAREGHPKGFHIAQGLGGISWRSSRQRQLQQQVMHWREQIALNPRTKRLSTLVRTASSTALST